MKNYNYLFIFKYGCVCWSYPTKIPDEGFLVTVEKNIPIKTTYRNLHMDNHIRFIEYLRYKI
jgi:hypothetical protein